MIVVLWIIAALVAAVLLWVIGRVRLVDEQRKLLDERALLQNWANDLTDYANSGARNGAAFDDLLERSAEVENALGRDNILHGVQVGNLIYNTARMLPGALYRVQQDLQTRISVDEAFQAMETIRSIILRNVGVRQRQATQVMEVAAQPMRCIALGWQTVIALPLGFLSAFGLMSRQKNMAVQSSFVFRLASVALFAAAVASPVLAYLADRAAIEAEATRTIRRIVQLR